MPVAPKIDPAGREPSQGMNLKWHLVRRIVVLAVACFMVGATFAIQQTVGAAHQQNATLAEAVGRQLELQLVRIDSALDVKDRFPDWDAVVSYGLAPGQCVQYANALGEVIKSNCAGADNRFLAAPEWFAPLCRVFSGGNSDAIRTLAFKNQNYGKIISSSNVAIVAAQAWAVVSPLLGLAASLMTLLCLLVYLVIDRALQPANQILGGLNQLAAGDLAFRLPPFKLEELNRISQVFNDLSGKLLKTTSERSELARRLVDAQESERRHVARELHDDIAQRLSALNALAASIRVSARSASPSIVSEIADLEKQTSTLMNSLRQTLTYLRPQELDDLGLVASLKGLVAGHNARANGVTRFSLQTIGDLDQLAAETSAHVYRIIQESLNNAAKHAHARTVNVTLAQGSNDRDAVNAQAIKIILDIVDDGMVSGESADGQSAGSGLIGMRERVMALSGTFTAGPYDGGGFGVHVEFPYTVRSTARE